MDELYDVIALHLVSGAQRVLASAKTLASAEAIIKMAVIRNGAETEIFKAVPHVLTHTVEL